MLCLSYGERGESAKAGVQGKAARRRSRRSGAQEASQAAEVLGAADRVRRRRRLPAARVARSSSTRSRCYRRVEPAVVLTHPLSGSVQPRSSGRPRWPCRHGSAPRPSAIDAPGEPLGAPPVFLFEPHQPEQCDFKPQVLLEITEVFERQARGPWSACRRSSTCGITTPTWPGGAASSCERNAGAEPRAAARHHGRGVHAVVYPQVTADAGSEERRWSPAARGPIPAEVAGLARRRRGHLHEAIGRTGYLGPAHPAGPPGIPDRRHGGHRRLLARVTT